MYDCLACMFVACDVSEAEPIPEENPEEPGDEERDAENTYLSEGKSHRSLALIMIAPK